jgi:hypothetical protein
LAGGSEDAEHKKYGCNSMSGGVLWGRWSVCAKSYRDNSALTN